jgi:hypothetical protein
MDKQKDNFAENIADHVADLLRQNRASEITNDLLHQADPHRLYQHYVSGNTGMHLPMDEKSRLERAEQMGFDIKSPLYHGTKEDFGHFMDYGKRRTLSNDEGTFLVDKPSVAEGYGSIVMPVFNRPASSVKQIDVGDIKSMYNLVPKEEKPWDGTYKSWKDYYKPGDLRMRDDYAKIYSDYISNGWDVHYSNINNLHTGKKGGTHNMRQVADPSNIRSQFARFDPRLAHLSHLSAATGGYIHKEDGGPITAYHGSPHDFEQFDTSKIGTGEGNQSYGHGLYFAESEPVAEAYRDRLSGHHVGDVKIGEETHPHWARKDVAKAFSKLGYDPQTSVIAAHYINEHKGDVSNALSEAWTNENLPDQVIEALTKADFAKSKGHMYEVAIDAHPDHFLDWDKPVSEQQKIIKLLKPTGFTPRSQSTTGNDLYHIIDNHFDDPKKASEFLHSAGIHGIRYLDAGSRGASEQPTHNYVVFDHNRVKIKRKYAKGGRVAYKKGGKVEGAIWHERDTFDDGGEVHEGDTPRMAEAEAARTESAPDQGGGGETVNAFEGRTGGNTEANATPPSFFDMPENVQNAQLALNNLGRQANEQTDQSRAQAAVLRDMAFNTQNPDFDNTAASLALPSSGATTTFGQPPLAGGVFTGGIPAQQAQKPVFMGNTTEAEQLAESMANPPTMATGTPAQSIAAVQPQHYEPTNNVIAYQQPATTLNAYNQGQMPQPTGIGPNAYAQGQMPQPIGAPSPINAYGQGQMPQPTGMPTATPATQPMPTAGNVPMPPIPLRDIQGPGWAEGIAGVFGLSTQQQFDKFNQQYLDQGMHPLDAYNNAISDIQTMRSNAYNTPSHGNRTQKVQKLMPDGTYQWVDEPYKRGGGVHSSKIVDHVLSKFGAPLPASNNPYFGNRAGRRR